jgi:ssDNA-binding Zn-finger/Zn-ribbon topoisomerase 1
MQLTENSRNCPKCQKELKVRVGCRGPFVGCTGYPDCRFSRDLTPEEVTAYEAETAEQQKQMEGTVEYWRNKFYEERTYWVTQLKEGKLAKVAPEPVASPPLTYPPDPEEEGSDPF